MAVQSIVAVNKDGNLPVRKGQLVVILDLEPGTELSQSGKMRRYGGSERGFETVTAISGIDGVDKLQANVYVGAKTGPGK